MAEEKIVTRIHKLLELSHSTNENEAATAAARASELMSEHAVTEAMLEVVDESDAAQAGVREREAIVKDGLPDAPERKVAWRDTIASAVAKSLDCEVYYCDGSLHAMGRASNVSAWKYTSAYLFAEVARLADEAWLVDGKDLAAVGERPRTWKGAFRLGAADVIANRLWQQKRDSEQLEKARAKELAAVQGAKELASGDVVGAGKRSDLALVRVDAALEIVRRDREAVKTKFKEMTSGDGWHKTRSIGDSTRGRGGYGAGREAGAKVSLGGGKQLKS